MFRNYLAAALRNLMRNRLYTVINIVGLTVGFAAALLIALFVRDELTYDTWMPGYEYVYRVASTLSPPGGPTIHTDAPGDSAALIIKPSVPDVAAITRLWPDERGLRSGTVEANETVVWADPEVFDVLPLAVVEGDLASALRSPDSIVITRAIARKYFGREDVVGETLEIDRQHPLRVTAVLKDLPARSHLNIKIIAPSTASFSPLVNAKCCGFALNMGFTYLKIKPGTLQVVERAFPAAIDRYVPPATYGLSPEKQKSSDVVSMELQPFSKIHMMSQAARVPVAHYGMLRPYGDKTMVSALLVTAVLILLVAVANFVNLMTAHATHRAVEVGVRKTSGAQRRDLIIQFLGESFLYLSAGLASALVFVHFSLPAFGAFLGRGMSLDYRDPAVATLLFAVLIIAGTLGGLYPAFILSAFRPATVLKNSITKHDRAGLIRQSLVVMQFAILIALMIATAVISRQTTFATADNFRLDTDQLLFLGSPCREAFKDQVAGLPGVRGVACAGRAWLGSDEAVALMSMPDGTRFNLNYSGVSPGLLELYGVKPVAGRLLSAGDGYSSDDPAGFRKEIRQGVINESAVRAFGYASPEAALGQVSPGGHLEVVGVVPDFPLRSLRDSVGAIAFIVEPRAFAYLVVKLDGSRVGETLRAIDQAWEKVGSGHPIARQFYNQHVQAQYTDIVRQTQAFTAFSAAAIFIACLGLFGLAAFTAEQRTKEIGVRKAMGARTRDILGLLIWQFAKPVLWANAIAWPVGYLVMNRWLEGFAYHIDLAPWMFLGASALALVIAIATVSGHAALVARAQPVAALRYE